VAVIERLETKVGRDESTGVEAVLGDLGLRRDVVLDDVADVGTVLVALLATLPLVFHALKGLVGGREDGGLLATVLEVVLETAFLLKNLDESAEALVVAQAVKDASALARLSQGLAVVLVLGHELRGGAHSREGVGREKNGGKSGELHVG